MSKIVAGSHLDPLNLYKDKSQAGLDLMQEQFNLSEKLLKLQKDYQDGKFVNYEKMVMRSFKKLDKEKNQDLCFVFQLCVVINHELNNLLQEKEISDYENIAISESLIEIIESMLELAKFPDKLEELIIDIKDIIGYICVCIKQVKTNQKLNKKVKNYTNDICMVANEAMNKLILQKPFEYGLSLQKSKDKGLIGLFDNRVVWGLIFAISYFTCLTLFNTVDDWNKWSLPYTWAILSTYVSFLLFILGGITNLKKQCSVLGVALFFIASGAGSILMAFPLFYKVGFGLIGRKDISDSMDVIYDQFRGMLDGLRDIIFKDKLVNDYSLWQKETKVYTELYKDYQNDVKEYYSDMRLASRNVINAVKSFKNLPEDLKIPSLPSSKESIPKLAYKMQKDIKQMNKLALQVSDNLYKQSKLESITDIIVLKQMEKLAPDMFPESSAVPGLLEIVEDNREQYQKKRKKMKAKLKEMMAKTDPKSEKYIPYLHGRSKIQHIFRFLYPADFSKNDVLDPVQRGMIEQFLVEKVGPNIPSREKMIDFPYNATLGLALFILILYLLSFLKSLFLRPQAQQQAQPEMNEREEMERLRLENRQLRRRNQILIRLREIEREELEREYPEMRAIGQ